MKIKIVYISCEFMFRLCFQKSQVIVDIENDAPNYGPKTVKIHMMIFNATDLKVHLLLKGIMRGITNIYFPFRIIKPQERQFKPKSLTVVYEHDPKESASKNRQITIGERQTDDKLLYVEQKRSTLDSRIANADFQFMNNSVFITSITFSFNVRANTSIRVNSRAPINEIITFFSRHRPLCF